MKLNYFFTYQKQLNERILINQNLNDYKITARMHLALQVNISELANETKCFVYWDNVTPSISRDIILEKYINCLNHIFTIGLDRKYTDIDEIAIERSSLCLSDQFLNLFVDINDLRTSPSKDHYSTLLEDFFALGLSLGLSLDVIKDTFFNKDIFEVALS
ncbi:dUTP diphosphatase [Clostridium sp.]|uniref:dUTP diphosphatase n=1 Tax=Clostridium sp. TaxID=1506 RepID=UPI0039932CFE